MTVKRLFSYAHVVMGLVILCLGVVTIIAPSVMTIYGLSTEDAFVRTAIRAIIGGGELAIGAGLILGRSIGVTPTALNGFAALIFLFVGTTRLTSAGFEGILTLGSQPLREGLIELSLALVSIAALVFSEDK